MALGSSGGTNLGSAYGKIHIDTTAMLLARGVVRNAAREMAEDTRRFGQEWDRASQTMRTSLRGISNDLKQTSSDLTGLSVAAGAVAFKGIQAARSLMNIDASFKVMLGSEKAARDELARLQQMADETNQPFTELAESGRDMLASAKANNIEVSKLVALGQQLKAVDPTARTFDVSVALREFMADSELSLFRRFEGLDKGRIKEIIDTTTTAQERVTALSNYLNELGFSRDLLKELGEEGVFAFDQLGSEITQTLDTAFRPFVHDVLLPAAQQFGAFLRTLRETDPVLLKIGAGFTLAAAAVAPMTFAVSQLLSTLSTLNRLGVVKVGVLVTAAVVGAEIGTKIAQGLADRGIGDQRLRSDSGEDPYAVLWERARQAMVVAFDLMIEASSRLAVMLWNVRFEIERAFLEITLTLIRAGISIQRAIGQDTSGLEAVGASYKERLGTVIDSQYTLNQADTLAAVQDQMRETFLKPFTDFLFPEVEVASEQTGEVITQTGNTIGGAIANAFRAWVGAANDSASKIRELNDQYEREAQRIAEQRDIADQRDTEDFTRSRGRDLADFGKDLADFDAQFIEQEAERIEDIQQLADAAHQEEIDKLKDFNKQSKREAEDHKLTLLNIQRDTSESLEDAIARGDSAAAQRAVRDGQKKQADEEQQFTLQQQRRAEDFEDMLRSMQLQRDQRIAAAMQQLADDRANYAAQRAEKIADFQARIALEDQERAIRLQREAEDRAREDRLRAEDLQLKEAAIRRESLANSAFVSELGKVMSAGREFLAQGAQAWLNMTSQIANSSAGWGGMGAPRVAIPRATGGDVLKGQLYRVAEQFPELYRRGDQTFLIPGGNGTIIPPRTNGGVGGMGNISLNVDMSGMTIQGAGRDLMETADELAELAAAKIAQKVTARLQARTT